jgi:hypothetical protein
MPAVNDAGREFHRAPDHEVLRRYGLREEEISAMSDHEKTQTVREALHNGVTAGAEEPEEGSRHSPIEVKTEDDLRRAEGVAHPEPTPKQAEAENYKHGHAELPHLGLSGDHSISIETAAGGTRHGPVDKETGKPKWSAKMGAAYGRVKSTKGADGEPLDIFIGPHPEQKSFVLVIDQRDPETKKFDEHKLATGFSKPADGLRAYLDSHDKDGAARVGGVRIFSPEEFKDWMRSGDKTKPASGDMYNVEDKPGTSAATVPEAENTLRAQQKQLTSGNRAVQMFPKGTPELPLPKGMERVETKSGDIFHYNGKRISPATILKASASGNENRLLGLGPHSKSDISARIARGEKPVAVIERSPDGTEVRAAAGTDQTAPTQLRVMENGKSAGNSVQMDQPEAVIGDRVSATKAGPKHHEAVKGALKQAGVDPDDVHPGDLEEAARIHAGEDVPPDHAFVAAVFRSLVRDGHINREAASKELGHETANDLLDSAEDLGRDAPPEEPGAGAGRKTSAAKRGLDSRRGKNGEVSRAEGA